MGAPPESAGRTDTVLAADPEPAAEPETVLEREAVEAEADFEAVGDRAGLDHEERERPADGRGRVAAFLVAVWAELRRVQWPDRPQLTSLTGVVLGFVLLAGGYLGLLDLIFSRLIQAIL